jgi:hypothetical protein
MNMTRWLMIAALALLSSSWARADLAEGQIFTITLTGWDADQSFTFTSNPTLPSNLPTDDPCYPSTAACGDPGVNLQKGGDQTAITSNPFSFTLAPPVCTTLPGDIVTCSFENETGGDIESIDLSTILTADEGGPDVLFVCDGGDVNTNCAFVVTAPLVSNAGDTMNVYFFSTPEPSLGIILMLGFTAMMFVLARRAKDSA